MEDFVKLNDIKFSKLNHAELSYLISKTSEYIWAYSIVHPSPELTTFISHINTLITDTNTSYNRRTAQKRKSKKGKETTT